MFGGDPFGAAVFGADALATTTVETVAPSGSVAPAGALALQRIRFVTLAGAVTPAGATVKRANKALAGAVTPAAAVSKVAARSFAGSVDPAGATTQMRGQDLTVSGVVTPAGVVHFVVAIALDGSVAPAGTLRKVVATTLAGEVGPTGSLNGSGQHVLALDGTITPAGDLSLVVHKGLAGLVTPGGALHKLVAQFLEGGVASAGSASVLSGGAASFAGTITPSGALHKSVAKALTGGITPGGALDALFYEPMVLVPGFSYSGRRAYIPPLLPGPGGAYLELLMADGATNVWILGEDDAGSFLYADSVGGNPLESQRRSTQTMASDPIGPPTAHSPLFNGTGQFAATTEDFLLATANVTLPSNTADFALEAWLAVVPSLGPSDYGMLSFALVASTVGAFCILLGELAGSDSGQVFAAIGADNGYSELGYRDGGEHHLVMTRVSSTLRLYVDTAEVVTVPDATDDLTGDLTLLAGGYGGSGGLSLYNLGGQMSWLAFYNGVGLTAAQVEAHYLA